MPVIFTGGWIIQGKRSLSDPGSPCDCDCDCACPDLPTWNPARPTPVTQLVRNPTLQTAPLDATYHAAWIPSGSHIAALDNDAMQVMGAFVNSRSRSDLPADWRSAWGDALDNTVDDLARLRFLISPEAAPLEQPTEGGRTLVAWLHVTNACNLRCRYCYLRKTDEAMSPEMGRAAIDAIFRAALLHSFSAVKLKYAGGEPTLNFPLVIMLHEYAAELAHQYGCDLEGVVLSNGVGLTHAMVDAMLAHDLRLMMSLDGIGPAHDNQRAFANGAGSCQTVSRSIERACAKGLVPSISITVTDRSVDGLAETVAWVLDRNLPFSFNFYRENDASASFEDLRLGEARLIQGMRGAFQAIETNLPRRSLRAALLDRANLAVPHNRTCSVGSNYMVVDPHGRISQCQMQMKQSPTSVAAEDPLASLRANPTGIQNLAVDEKEGCRDCEWRYWCTGGCPLQTFRATGRYDVKSPNCNIYRALFPDVLRLEGLRLLKYADA